MNAVSVYVSTAKLVLQSTETTHAVAASVSPELSRLLINLRQLLSCVVCCRLVNDPYAPYNALCSHNVCRLCVRGKKLLLPACSYCKDNKDFKTYNENKQLRCLLLCYKSLCEHIRCSTVFGHFAGLKVGQYNSTSIPTVVVPQMTLQELINEGASYDDVLNAFNSDLPKPLLMSMAKPTQMPALVTPLTSIAAATPLVPIQNAVKIASMQQSAPKASTPPAVMSTPVSSYGTKIKTENTTQTQFKHHSSSNQTPNISLHTSSSQEHHSNLNPAVTHAQLVQLNQLKNSGNITYIGPNTRGIVVPIVSSSGSTAVPLSIASARLQTLNRQLAQARALAVSTSTTSATTSTNAASSTTLEQRNTLGSFKSAAVATQNIKSSKAITTSSSLPSTTSCVTTTSQLRNPPPIKTVSNGSAMYSVLYTGIGNKITIKRKTDGDEDTTLKKNTSFSTSSSNLLRNLPKTPNKKRGCRCGNTTATPGKLTCCGQRCPCYVDSKSCIGCKCRGCRNPHRPDGNKVRPIIPELACYEIQMADDLGNVNELPIATTSNALNVLSNDKNNSSGLSTALSLNAASSLSPATAVVTSTSSNTTLIPIRGLHHFSTTSNNSNSSVTTTIIPPLTSTTMPTQTSSMTQASFNSNTASLTPVSVASSMSPNITAPGSIVQLDQIQRESLLIQNAEGKFQVVNVFTTGSNAAGNSCAGQTSNQMPTLQRIKTLPQTVVSAQNSFVLPTSISTSSISGTTTTTALPQLIIQSQQQQQQHQTQQHILQHNQQHLQQQHHYLNQQPLLAQRVSNNVVATSLPLQLQQQLKQNIITVHAIHTNPASNTSPVTAPVLTPTSSPAPTSAAISLPPLVANNSHTSLELTDTTEVSRNTFANIIVSSSASSSENNTTTTSSITSIPLTLSLSGATVHTQSLNRKSLNSPSF